MLLDHGVAERSAERSNAKACSPATPYEVWAQAVKEPLTQLMAAR